MLLQFTFKNFRSFRDEATLDLTATRERELDFHIMECANEKVLPIAAIYGANASGKSNVIEALRYMREYVTNSLEYGGTEGSRRRQVKFMKPTPFLLDSASRSDVSSFEVYFIEPVSQKEYNYGFSVSKEGVSEEWLKYTTKSARGEYKTIFSRTKEKTELPGISPRHQENIRIAMQKETLILTLGAVLHQAKLMAVWNWFGSIEAADFGTPIENLMLSTQLPQDFEDNAVQQDVVSYFSIFDPSIIGFKIEKIEDDDPDSTRYKVDALHRQNDATGSVSIPLANESAGTLKMFSLYPMLKETLASGGIMLVDELNAKLHPLLSRNIIQRFADPAVNPKHAQLIFTVHDPWLLDSDTMRRDEIWFTEKSEDGASSLYSLAEFKDDSGEKVRREENFARNYMLGKYGAIPEIRPFNERQRAYE